MDNSRIIDFFDKRALLWDSEQVINGDVVQKILTLGGIQQGVNVLDIACGTGVLFDYYLERKVASVTGIDISPEMVKMAREKFPSIPVFCGDAHDYSFGSKFDAVMIFNAFPHFQSPERLFENLSGTLADGGRLTVAHSMSRDELQLCHATRAKEVSLPLPDEKELSELMGKLFNVDIAISDSMMYIVSGTKK